ncbi:hypothetical protein YC2023_078620 [Brassica napus]
MGNKRIEAMMIMVMIMMVFSWRICEAERLRRHTASSSRPQRFFKVRRPNPLHHNHNHGFIDDDYPPETFSGLLPKTMPIPPSAPSKKHNVYGLQKSFLGRNYCIPSRINKIRSGYFSMHAYLFEPYLPTYLNPTCVIVWRVMYHICNS